MTQKEKSEERERTLIRGCGLAGFGGSSNVEAVDVKDGKIVRIRPFPYDWKYKPEEFRPWRIEARGKVFEATLKSPISPHDLGYKKRIYSPNRILYPLKRVDWDPSDERHPENRGTSGYVRISWDNALELVASEIRRVIKKYGPEAVLLQADGHGEGKPIHACHGCAIRLLNLLGGHTLQIRNPDSWEGWYWGAKHVWGTEPHGTMTPYHANLLPDIAENTELMLFWGGDPETTPWGFGGGQTVSQLCYWFTDLGIKCIYICPDLNYAAAVHADKWIPIRPNTDAALQLAIAYLWITEGTYDKDYVATHTFGFDKFEEYVLGKEDGIPKTPEWAEEKTAIPSPTIKALAREWASKRTTVAHCYGGPYIRGPYSHEPARLEVLLLAMQGVGKPGVHQFQMTDGMLIQAYLRGYVPRARPDGIVKPLSHRGAYRGINLDIMPKQIIPRTMIHEAILKGSFTIYGSSNQKWPAEDQFKKYVYPVEGCSEIHMIWTDVPCNVTCWDDGNSYMKAYRSPKIEFMLAQHPWLENDCLFADIILPANTKFEVDDIGVDAMNYLFDTIFLSEKCVHPIGESKSDYEIVCAVADKLGLLDEYTEGKSVDEWIKTGFDKSGVPEAGLISWEEFKEKQYYVVPTDPEWKKHRAGMIGFYEDPEKNPLNTPSGKIEFYSQNLAKHFPDDDERPPVPHWIEKSESHDERISSKRAKKYPLLCQSNHPRWRVHANLDDIDWFHEIVTCKVRGPDGYLYEPIWMNPVDAEKRCIENGDVVKIYNERGGVLVGARVWERIIPGVVYVDHGARYDPIVPGKLDRGGAINTITPYMWTSRNCAGNAVSGFLVEVGKVNLDELMRKYPEAFEREYDPASGLRFNAWVDGSM